MKITTEQAVKAYQDACKAQELVNATEAAAMRLGVSKAAIKYHLRKERAGK